ncbi:hypothetical protein [Rhodovulum sulfidophilum]|uniref:hypothetical protein n=1 Tax=Rhodovulum sulfidophilum TaxID=35806 RepID=UPI001F48D766|nr:hypothetical protein [Rhodovulum sulfidophilum]
MLGRLSGRGKDMIASTNTPPAPLPEARAPGPNPNLSTQPAENTASSAKNPAPAPASPADPLAGYLDWAGQAGLGTVASTVSGGAVASGPGSILSASESPERERAPQLLDEMFDGQSRTDPAGLDAQISRGERLLRDHAAGLEGLEHGYANGMLGTAWQTRAERLQGQAALDASGRAIDAYGAALAVRTLEADRAGHGQTQMNLGTAWLNGAIKGTESKLFDGSLIHGGQPLMSWCVGNAKTEPRRNAVIVTKAVSGAGKIDPLMAAFDAVYLMSLNRMRGDWLYIAACERVDPNSDDEILAAF